MGICYEARADKTRFIIDEDYKVKEAMLKTIQNYTKTKNEPIIEEQPNLYQKIINDQKGDLSVPNKTLGNNEKIISKNRNMLTEVYKPEGPLGEGGYGQVYLVRHKKMGLLRAMKVIPVNYQNEEEKTDEEIELLRQLDHPS